MYIICRHCTSTITLRQTFKRKKVFHIVVTYEREKADQIVVVLHKVINNMRVFAQDLKHKENILVKFHSSLNYINMNVIDRIIFPKRVSKGAHRYYH